MTTIPSLIAPTSSKLSTTILIVDDSETDRATYCRYLNSDVTIRYQILEAETLEEALEILQYQNLDLVLLDFNLPDGDGLELLETINKDFLGKLAVIMLTGQGDERIAVQAMKQGAMDYLIKKDITQISLCHSIHSLFDISTLNHKIAQLKNYENIIAGVALGIQKTLNLETVYQRIVQEIQAVLKVDRTVIYKFNSDMTGEIVAQAIVPPWQPFLHSHVVDICLKANMDETYQQDQILAVSDIYEANLSKCHIQLLERFQIRANLVIPILLPNPNFHNHQSGTEVLWGLLVVNKCSQPRIWEDTDIGLMQQLSVQLAIAIQQAELHKNLQASEAELHGLFNAMVDVILVLDKQGRYLKIAPTNADKLYLPAKKLIGKTAHEIFSHDQADEFVSIIQKTLTTRQTLDYEYKLEIDNQELWFSAKVSPISPETVVWAARDITESKQSENALRESEEKFRQFAENGRGVMLVRQIDSGKILYVNPAYAEIWGQTCESLYENPNSWMAYIHPDDRERIHTAYQAIAGKGYFNHEYRIIRPDGTIRWIWGRCFPISDPAGEIYRIGAIAEDITERKVTEQERDNLLQVLEQQNQSLEAQVSQRTAELQKSEEFNRSIFENNADCLKVLDLDGNIISINQSGKALMEIDDPSLVLGKQWVQFWIKSDQKAAMEAIEVAKTGSITCFQGFCPTARGIPKWWDVLVAPVVDLEGNISHLIATSRDITAHREADKQLRNLSDRLNLAIKSAQIGIWDWDIVNNHLVWDERMCQLYGIKSSDFAGAYQAWEAGLHPDDLPSCRIAIQKAITGEKDFEAEFRIVSSEDTTKFIKAHAIVQRNVQGKAQRMIGINVDITNQRREELENQRLKERLEFVLSASPAVIYTCQTSGNFQATFISKNVKTILGYTQETWLKEPNFWLNKIHPEDLPQVLSILSHLEQQEDHIHQYRFLHQDDNYRWLEDEFRLVRDEMGKITEIIGYVVDISEQKAVMRERELVEAEILRSRDLLEAIFNESADALFLVDTATLKTLDCNQRAIEMFKASDKNHLIGIAGHQLQKHQFTPEELTAINNDIEIQGMWSREIEYKTFNGEFFWGNLAAKQIAVAGQNMNLVRVTDIGQRKLAETQLQETNKQLAASNAQLARATRLKDEFLANMSHELRTPLNAILGISEGLQDEILGAINERQRRGLQTIERSGTHLLALINDILDLSKIEAGQVELDCTPTAINQLCRSSLSFIKQQAFQKQIQFDLKIQADLPDLLVDERRIQQVLINLLSNAVKFTLEGGKITLKVTWEQYPPESKISHRPDLIRIAVIDTGIGIASENLPKLFAPFVQIDSSLSRKYTGTGLGLSLVKRIVEMHGGQVDVSSKIGVGSCFIVDLPCTSMPKSSCKSVNQSANLFSVLNDKAQASPLILLAEDNKANILTFSSYLEAKGYRLVLAENGLEAIEITKSHCPDLILMDIQMPEMDGLEAIKQIRLNPDSATVPIIALTALAMPGDEEKCLAAGANEYLSKPIKLKKLVNIIQGFLE
jgi:PAS domain S-box-containing protein